MKQCRVCPDLYPIKMISSLEECMFRAQSSTRALFIAGLFKKDCTHTRQLDACTPPNETRFIWMKNSWKIPKESKLLSSFTRLTQALLCASCGIRWTRFYTHGLDQTETQEEALRRNWLLVEDLCGIVCLRDPHTGSHMYQLVQAGCKPDH